MSMKRSLSSPAHTRASTSKLDPTTAFANPVSRPASGSARDEYGNPSNQSEISLRQPLQRSSPGHKDGGSPAAAPIQTVTRSRRDDSVPDPVCDIVVTRSQVSSHSTQSRHSSRQIGSLQTPSTYSVPQEGSRSVPDQPAAKESPPPILQAQSSLSPKHGHTTLEDLARHVRLAKLEERKCASSRSKLHKTLISVALSARLLRCGEVSSRDLVNSLRKDDKHAFVVLHDALQDVRNSCEEFRRFALLEPDVQSASPPMDPTVPSTETFSEASSDVVRTMPFNSFLDNIAGRTRDVFVTFLDQLRTNPDFLASRLCQLSKFELNALLSSYKDLEPHDSVLPTQSRSPRRSNVHLTGRSVSSSGAKVERLLSFQRRDPLALMIHACFADSAVPGSSEDQRRTDVWATACARLIASPSSHAEQFLITVVTIWTTMRGWHGKSNMELFLMKILQDGAFLLDRAEDQHGTRFNLSDWSQSDELAAEAFYDIAVGQLFELVDDEGSNGIPDGLLELGNAILRRIDSKLLDTTARWLVWRCLFCVFLSGVIVQPEDYGLLTNYHITPYAREKILKKVATKAYSYVSSMWSGKSPSRPAIVTTIPLAIRQHVENILARFGQSQLKAPAARLQPVRSITSLKETVEACLYLTLCPADLITMVDALFPERRPYSPASSLRSGSLSIPPYGNKAQSGTILNPRQSLGAFSTISTSVGSTLSESSVPAEVVPGTSRASVYHPRSSEKLESSKSFSRDEDFGDQLRLAVHDLMRSTGCSAFTELAHPCAERWATLFISDEDGRLSSDLLSDSAGIDTHLEQQRFSSYTQSPGEMEPRHVSDVDVVRDSVITLLQDFEVPENHDETGSLRSPIRIKTSNPEGRHKSPADASTSKASAGTLTGSSEDHKTAPTVKPRPATSSVPHITSESEPLLVVMLKAACAHYNARSDFVSAYKYWKTLNDLNGMEPKFLRKDGFAALIDSIAAEPRATTVKCAAENDEYDAWIACLKETQVRYQQAISRMMSRVRHTRNKMWYITEVRNSKEFTHTRDICQALKTMGSTRRWKTFQKSRQSSARASNASYMQQTESQVIDLIAASETHGGPNKLTDEQVRLTVAWLKQSGVENFCQGEERIHRFCCEVEKCISRLVGDTIAEAPVLWSSDLFRRDKLKYDRLRSCDRESGLSGDDTPSAGSYDIDRRFRATSSGRDLRNMSLNNGSRISLDSSRYNVSRMGAALPDGLDAAEYLARFSPVQTQETLSTFWSPFRDAYANDSIARTYSPATSLTNLSTTFSAHEQSGHPFTSSSVSMGRPSTSASSTEAVFQGRMEDRKTSLLNELKENLTSLLLSDVGIMSNGSETDAWFREFGQHCIDRKVDRGKLTPVAVDQTDRETKVRSSARPRVIEKKKSFGDLRRASSGVSESNLNHFNRPAPLSHKQTLAVDEPQFPFRAAYQRLLNIFSVHPSPFAKLKALRDLESLITASISVKVKWETGRGSSDDESKAAADERCSQSGPLEDTIGNVKHRRTDSQMPRFSVPRGSKAAERGSSRTADTDVVTNELYKIFKDADIRPEYLFRDLQLIAAFVPASILDKPELGRAFWNAGLAALKLKSKVCRIMMEMADEIVATDTHVRKATTNPSTAESMPHLHSPPPSTVFTKMEDGGRMWAITAKEGFPTAQRELALFYLSRPEYVDLAVLPLSKPQEVFKQAVMNKYSRNDRARMFTSGASSSSSHNGAMAGQYTGPSTNSSNSDASQYRPTQHTNPSTEQAAAGSSTGSNKTKGEVDARNDPRLMCAAFHWMEAAERGGDEVAKTFLRQNEILGSS